MKFMQVTLTDKNAVIYDNAFGYDEGDIGLINDELGRYFADVAITVLGSTMAVLLPREDGHAAVLVIDEGYDEVADESLQNPSVTPGDIYWLEFLEDTDYVPLPPDVPEGYEDADEVPYEEVSATN